MREPDANHHLSSLLSQLSSLQETSSSHFDQPSASHDDFLSQMLSSVPPTAVHWPDVHSPLPHFEEQSPTKPRPHPGVAKALMLQQQMLLSRGIVPISHADHNDVVDGSSINPANPANDASVKVLLMNGFSGSLGQTPDQPFHQSQGGELQQNIGAAAAAGGGGAAGQPRQKVRARRGQATDPHSIAERLRRERIAERMKALQELVPNANKTDKASMLDEIIDYVKFLQLQVKVLSMSRLGGAAAVAPLVAGISSEGRSPNGTKMASSSNTNDGMSASASASEQQVLKMMEEDMGSAMQYLQGKGLCLMPISLATAISTATCRPRNPLNANNNPLFKGGEAGGGPPSPSLSALTAQSAATGGNGGGEASVKDSSSPSKLD